MRKRPNDVEKLDRISSAMDADKQGNITAGKDVKIDGKLKLTSLVSSSNPDGDITKELGGGGSITLYRHCILLIGTAHNPADVISFNLYNTNSAKLG